MIQNSNEMNRGLKSMFETNGTQRMSAIKVVVDVKPSKLFDTLSKAVFNELLRMANTAVVTQLEELGPDGILMYLKTLLYLRVNYSNGDAKPSIKDYRSLSKFVTVPSLLYQVLVSIGPARDDSYGIVFEPAYSITDSELLSPEEVAYISDLLSTFPTLSAVSGIPTTREGDLLFMAMNHVNGVITSYKESHPVYGFLAAFFQQMQYSEVTGSMSRILYGTMDDYNLLVETGMRAFVERGGQHDETR